MEDLREKTHYLHYELYRKKRLEEMGFEDNTGYVCVCACVRACVCVCLHVRVHIESFKLRNFNYDSKLLQYILLRINCYHY